MDTLTKPFHHEYYPKGYTMTDYESPFNPETGHLRNASSEMRSHIRGLMKKFNSNPSEYLKQKLEDYGITVDYSDKDHGEPPVPYNQL